MDAIGQCFRTNSMEVSICWPVKLMARSMIIMGEGSAFRTAPSALFREFAAVNAQNDRIIANL